jgi:hypothetical protein
MNLFFWKDGTKILHQEEFIEDPLSDAQEQRQKMEDRLAKKARKGKVRSIHWDYFNR